MKDGPISKLIITKNGYWPTQYKKIVDTLPVLCTNKNHRGIDDAIWTRNDLVEMNFILTYPNANQWPTTHHVEVRAINPTDPAAIDGSRPPTITMEQ